MEVGECDVIFIESDGRPVPADAANTVTRDEADAIVALASRIGTVDHNFRPKIDGSFLRLGQCVGALSVPGLNLLIRPKIEVDSKGRLLKHDEGVLDLAAVLGSAESLSLPNVEFATPGPVDDGMLLRYADVFTRDLLFVLRDGLRGGYVQRNDSISSVRGRILFNAPASFDRPHLISCAFQEFTFNTLLNQTLKRGVALVHRLIASVEAPDQLSLSKVIRGRCRRLFELMDDVDDVSLGWSEVFDLEVSRLDHKFENVLKFAKLILKCNAPTLYADNVEGGRYARAGFSYLWDIKKLFERHVADYLKQWVSSCPVSRQLKLEVRAQDSSFRVLNDNRSNQLFPDIVIYLDKKPVLIIDTKWKRLPLEFSAMERNDAYQMLAYAMTYSWNIENRSAAVPVCLLYPSVGKAVLPRISHFKGTGSPLAIAACPMDRRNMNFSPAKVFGQLWPSG